MMLAAGPRQSDRDNPQPSPGPAVSPEPVSFRVRLIPPASEARGPSQTLSQSRLSRWTRDSEGSPRPAGGLALRWGHCDHRDGL